MCKSIPQPDQARQHEKQRLKIIVLMPMPPRGKLAQVET
jgi:hypothetical protein